MHLSRFVLFLICLFAAAVGLAADGDLDDSFGNAGIALAGPSRTVGVPSKPAVQADGKIVFCDTYRVPGVGDAEFQVSRFHADGRIDTGFGQQGRTMILFASAYPQNNQCTGVAIAPDGRIVVVGESQPLGGNGIDFAVARLTSTGQLDTTFSGDGMVTVGFDGADAGQPGDDRARAVVVQANGRIVVAGETMAAGSNRRFAVLRLRPDGSRDTTFNGTGRVVFGFGLYPGLGDRDGAQALALDTQGRILVAGSAIKGLDDDTDFAVARLRVDGSLDSSFGNDGRASVAFDVGSAANMLSDVLTDITVLRSGGIVLAGLATTALTDEGEYSTDMAFAWLRPDGAIDTAVGLNGRALVAFDLVNRGIDAVTGVVEQADGMLAAVGYVQTGGGANRIAPAALRLRPDGDLDERFGDYGKRVYAIGSQTNSHLQTASGIALHGGGLVTIGAAANVQTQTVENFVMRIQTSLADDTLFRNGFD